MNVTCPELEHCEDVIVISEETNTDSVPDVFDFLLCLTDLLFKDLFLHSVGLFHFLGQIFNP